jgi:hypothetical protein
MESAILNHQKAVHLMPDHNLANPCCLMILGDALRPRFERFGNGEDLDRATSGYQKAVDLIPEYDSSELSPHNILANMGHVGNLNSHSEVRVPCCNEMIRTSFQVHQFRIVCHFL